MEREEPDIRIYERMRDELIRSQLSNSENFDKAMLSLSSAGLGLTISFISNLIDLSIAVYLSLLYLTWIFFIIAIISTILSFLVSQIGIRKQLDSLESIYIEKKEVNNESISKISKLLNKLTITSAIAFMLAIIMLILFSITNISNGAIMSKNSKPTIYTEGASINNLQKTVNNNINKGATINNLQPAPKKNAQTSTTTIGNSGSNNKK